MQTAIRLDQSALESFELAVVTLDANGVCAFANRAAAGLLAVDPDDATGWSLPDIFPEPGEAEQVQHELQKRLRGEASSYVTAFTRPRDGKKIPVSIYAFPILDAAHRIEGSMAIVSDMRVPLAKKQMHVAIESCRDGARMLAAFAKELGAVLPFDEFRVTALSLDRQHLRTLFSTLPFPAQRYPFKWWPMPPFVAPMAEDSAPRIYDIPALFRRSDFREMAESDQASADYRDSGVVSSIAIPVVSGERTIAFASLDTKGAPYTEADLALCRKLPFPEAVKMALHLEEVKALRACLAVIRQMGSTQGGVQPVAQVLVDALAASFGWEHIAVFRHDEDNGVYVVLAQASATDSSVKKDFAVDETSIVAQCFRERCIVNVPDVQAPLPDGVQFLPGVPGIRSELAMPIHGVRARWVLNVESALKHAFAQEEIDLLLPLLLDAGHILEQIQLTEIQTAVLDGISDAVFETNRSGVIRSVNPAAVDLLGAESDAQLVGQQLASFLADGDLVRELIQSGQHFSTRELRLVRKNKQPVPVLLSGSDLKQDGERRVFFASDLSYMEEVERGGMLKDVFRHASLECRVPLALATGWLDRLVERKNELEPDIDRVLEQIRKADMPLERLLRAAEPPPAVRTAPATTDLRHVVQDVLEQLPQSEREQIDKRIPAGKVPVRGDEDDLRFCVETVLSFAYRTKPSNGRVSLEMLANGERATLRVSGDWEPLLGSDAAAAIRRRWRRTAAADLALADDVIQDIASRADGRFHSVMDGELRLELDLPLAKEA